MAPIGALGQGGEGGWTTAAKRPGEKEILPLTGLRSTERPLEEEDLILLAILDLLALDEDLKELVEDDEEDLRVGLDPPDEREGKDMREARFALLSVFKIFFLLPISQPPDELGIKFFLDR